MWCPFVRQYDRSQSGMEHRDWPTLRLRLFPLRQGVSRRTTTARAPRRAPRPRKLKSAGKPYDLSLCEIARCAQGRAWCALEVALTCGSAFSSPGFYFDWNVMSWGLQMGAAEAMGAHSRCRFFEKVLRST